MIEKPRDTVGLARYNVIGREQLCRVVELLHGESMRAIERLHCCRLAMLEEMRRSGRKRRLDGYIKKEEAQCHQMKVSAQWLMLAVL